MPNVREEMLDYYYGHEKHKNHPWMPATGTEGRCELCAKMEDDSIHKEPYQVDEEWEKRRHNGRSNQLSSKEQRT